ncbi:Glu/Leu/Phe/Val dehydrogenase dimerization domain-containing protein [Microbacterium marinilacus]|uniref:Glu/Leu/Phe/Val dehydrogenase dimerization domain-containing protein n=1 Tax=Microbacterium marinilacus TaxID=415209 RepID=A0ABP7BH83_9MICO|nr:Glu/Leu/Phe/Val dehydrogenase dimerization domain-containing protein [Microbacterium marinilacus]MBY0689562.1 valine dehydrogenase [Microbacterium marinilacus]
MRAESHPAAAEVDVDASGHEEVLHCHDEATGLHAIIAIHDTTLGPGLGGTRFRPYASEQDALRDALRLSRGMTSKNAAAGLPFGGAKAVIIGDPRSTKTPELLRAYGRFVDGLGGRYVTAADLGTNSDDLDIVGEETTHITGRTAAAGGAGDSGPATALGVFSALSAAADRLWGGLSGRTVGIEGAGKVGGVLARLLVEAGATVVVADPDPAARERVRATGARAAEETLAGLLDVYAPCALGATVTVERVTELGARLVCGAANNQLPAAEEDAALHAAGILWVPDYVANAGGVIHLAGYERLGRTPAQVDDDVRHIAETTREILAHAAEAGIPTGAAADEVVAARLAAARG